MGSMLLMSHRAEEVLHVPPDRMQGSGPLCMFVSGLVSRLGSPYWAFLQQLAAWILLYRHSMS